MKKDKKDLVIEERKPSNLFGTRTGAVSTQKVSGSAGAGSEGGGTSPLTPQNPEENPKQNPKPKPKQKKQTRGATVVGADKETGNQQATGGEETASLDRDFAAEQDSALSIPPIVSLARDPGKTELEIGPDGSTSVINKDAQDKNKISKLPKGPGGGAAGTDVDAESLEILLGQEFATCFDVFLENWGLTSFYALAGGTVIAWISKQVGSDIRQVTKFVASKHEIGRKLITQISPKYETEVSRFAAELETLKQTTKAQVKQSSGKEFIDDLKAKGKTLTSKTAIINRTIIYTAIAGFIAAEIYGRTDPMNDMLGNKPYDKDSFGSEILRTFITLRFLKALFAKKAIDVSTANVRGAGAECNILNILVLSVIAAIVARYGYSMIKNAPKKATLDKLFKDSLAVGRSSLSKDCQQKFGDAFDLIIGRLRVSFQGNASEDIFKALEETVKPFIVSGNRAQAQQNLSKITNAIANNKELVITVNNVQKSYKFFTNDSNVLLGFGKMLADDLQEVYRVLLNTYGSKYESVRGTARNSLSQTESELDIAIRKLQDLVTKRFAQVQKLASQAMASGTPKYRVRSAMPTIDLKDLSNVALEIEKFAIHGDPFKAIQLSQTLGQKLSSVQGAAVQGQKVVLGQASAESIISILQKLNSSRNTTKFDKKTLENIIELAENGAFARAESGAVRTANGVAGLPADEIIQTYAGDLLYYMADPSKVASLQKIQRQRRLLVELASKIENAIYAEAAKQPKFFERLTGSKTPRELINTHPFFTISALAAFGVILNLGFNASKTQPGIDKSPIQFDTSRKEYSIDFVTPSVSSFLNGYTGATQYLRISNFLAKNPKSAEQAIKLILNPRNNNVRTIIDQIASEDEFKGKNYTQEQISEKVEKYTAMLAEAQKDVILSVAMSIDSNLLNRYPQLNETPARAARIHITDLLIYKSGFRQRLQNYYSTVHPEQSKKNRIKAIKNGIPAGLSNKVFVPSKLDYTLIGRGTRDAQDYASRKIKFLKPSVNRSVVKRTVEAPGKRNDLSFLSDKNLLNQVIFIGDSNAANMVAATFGLNPRQRNTRYTRLKGAYPGGYVYVVGNEKVPYGGPAMGAATTNSIVSGVRKYFDDPNVPRDRIENLRTAIIHMGYNDGPSNISHLQTLENLKKIVRILETKGINDVRVIDVKVDENKVGDKPLLKNHIKEFRKALIEYIKSGESKNVQLIVNNSSPIGDGYHFRDNKDLTRHALMSAKKLLPSDTETDANLTEEQITEINALAAMLKIETSGLRSRGSGAAAACAFFRQSSPDFPNKMYDVVHGPNLPGKKGQAWNSSRTLTIQGKKMDGYVPTFQKLFMKFGGATQALWQDVPGSGRQRLNMFTESENRSLRLAIYYIKNKESIKSRFGPIIGFVHPGGMPRKKSRSNTYLIDFNTVEIPGNPKVHGKKYVPKWVLSAIREGRARFSGSGERIAGKKINMMILAILASGGRSKPKNRTPTYNLKRRRKAGGTIGPLPNQQKQQEVKTMNKLDLKQLVEEILNENSGQGYNKYPYHSDYYSEEEPREDYIEEWKSFCLQVIRDESRSTAIEVAKVLIKDLELFEDVLDLAGQNQSVGVEILSKLKQARENKIV